MEKRGPVIIFEFAPPVLRICRSVLQRDRRRVITHCSSVSASGADPDVSCRLRDHLRRNRIGSGSVVLIIPRQAALWRSFRLPARDLAEARTILAWRLRREAGMPAGRSFVYDLHLIGRDEDGSAIVSVFFAPADNVLAYVRLLERARVFPREVTLSSQGLADWAAQTAPAEEYNYVLQTGSGGQEFCVAQAGVPIFSRTFKLTGLPRERPRHLLREVKISYELFRRLKRMPGAALEGFHVVGRLGAEEAACLAPYVKSLSEAQADFSSVISRSGRLGGARIDMMPSLLRQRLRREVLWRRGLRCFVLAYCLIWAAYLLSWSGVIRHMQAAAAYRKIAREAQPDMERFTAWARELAFRRDAWGQAGLSGLLEEVLRVLPEGTVLTKIKGECRSVTLTGSSPDVDAVLGLRRVLALSPHFNRVHLDFLSRDGREGLQRFSIHCSVKAGEGS